jgi:ketosteroid isomerase-like protein
LTDRQDFHECAKIEAVSALQAAERYVEAVNARDPEQLLALFAPDATVVNTFGLHEGADQIRAFYVELVFANEVTVQITNVIDGGKQCAIEVDGHSPATDVVQKMTDVFTVGGDGRITRLSIYRR